MWLSYDQMPLCEPLADSMAVVCLLTTTYASFTYSLFKVSILSLSGVARFDGLESLRRLASGTPLSFSRTISRNSDVRAIAGILK